MAKTKTNMMNYVSTRGRAPVLGFDEALLAGLARDGGLYLPQSWPEFSPEQIAALAGKTYAEAAFQVIWPYVEGVVPAPVFAEILDQAYAGFDHGAVTPLVQIGDEDWLLELFHGPTLAFKDVAMQALSRLMDWALAQRGQRVTIVGATSGDTGGAAIEAFRGLDAIDIFILHPEGRVSEVQRRQMTTREEDNVHNIAVQGTFDDCQALVKAMFNDLELRDELSLAGVNSINWARIVAQIVYYFTAAVAIGAPARSVSFSVPTGNFGDIFAGYAAVQMGLPVSRLVIATNANDILARTLETGRYEARQVQATSSPSMDIQVSSNFERLLFELSGRNANRVNQLMTDFQNDNVFTLGKEELASLHQLFLAERIDERETAATIMDLFAATGYIADPHTAVGFGAANKLRKSGKLKGPVITLATAHPAKFPEAVEKAIGQSLEEPPQIIAQKKLKERYDVLPNSFEPIVAHIKNRARTTRGK